MVTLILTAWPIVTCIGEITRLLIPKAEGVLKAIMAKMVKCEMEAVIWLLTVSTTPGSSTHLPVVVS